MNFANVGLRVEIEPASASGVLKLMTMMMKHGGKGGALGGGKHLEELIIFIVVVVVEEEGVEGGSEVGEIEVGVGAVETPGGFVVGQGGLFGCGEGAEPEAGPLLGLADLGDPLAPGSLADAPVLAGCILGSPFAPRRALLPWLLQQRMIRG